MNTAPLNDLQRTLIAIEGKPHTEYKQLTGSHQYEQFILRVEYVPDQPDLSPARLRITVPLDSAKFPRDVFTPKSREIAARDFLARQFASQAKQLSISTRGMVGGSVSIERPGQEILETNAVVIGGDVLEIRCTIELPVIRRRIPDGILLDLFMKRIPALVKRSLTYDGCDGQALVRWIEITEDADAIRAALPERGLAAFIANGSELPKKHPRDREPIVPLAAPESCAVTIEVPNRGTVTGLGIPRGITVIAGGWHQGKTTLLRAISAGVYNHIPGDGRELAVAPPDATMIRTEEGRRIERADLSAIFPEEPGDTFSKAFSVNYASPAASMAANLMEALEIGTSLVLFDDETSAPPLIAGDAVGRELVDGSQHRPRTLADILPVLRDTHNISAIVVSDAAELLAVADTVLRMERFIPVDVTPQVRDMNLAVPTAIEPFPLPLKRTPLSRSLQPPRSDRPKSSPGRAAIQYGDEFIDISGIPQIVSKAQGRAIGRAIALVDRLIDGSPSLADAIGKVMERIEQIGLDALSNRLMGDLAMFRSQELAAVINRMRQLQIR